METIQVLTRNALQQLTHTTPTETTTLLRCQVDPFFATWRLTGAETLEERKTLNDMLEAARQFCADFLSQTEPRWLVLTGLSGSGKTFLASAISELFRTHARSVYNLSVRPKIDPAGSNPNLLWSYRQTGPFLRKWTKAVDVMRDGDYGRARELGDDWVKIIDDLGAESTDRDGRPTPFVVAQMGKICDARLGKWTVLTSNFSPREMGELFDGRIASRMLRGQNVCVHSRVRDFGVRRLAERRAA